MYARGEEGRKGAENQKVVLEFWVQAGQFYSNRYIGNNAQQWCPLDQINSITLTFMK